LAFEGESGLAVGAASGGNPNKPPDSASPRSASRSAFARLQASDAEVVQEPTEPPYGVRDCAVRDPAGNLIRIQERR
jgi:catechol 2,3-dioxygenase-like lactoylglutathione lyase family enzyme